MTIGIIGCGWLGFPFAQYCIKQGHQVVGSTTQSKKLPILAQAGIIPVQLSLQPQGLLGDSGPFQQVDAVVLNVPPGARRNPAAGLDYPDKIHHLLTALPKVPCLFVSSTSVYGALTGRITETVPPKPKTAGGKALVAAENLLKHSQQSYTILRLGGLIGPKRHPIKFLSGKQALPQGDAPVNLVELQDVIQAMYAIVEQARWQQTYHLAAPSHPSKTAYYSYCAQQRNLPLPQFEPGGADQKQIDSTFTASDLSIEWAYADPYAMPISI